MQESRKYLGIASAACGVAIVALLFMPFAGFTERFDYGSGPAYDDVEVTGLGTYVEGLSLFEYPEYVVFAQISMVLLALVLAYVGLRAVGAYRTRTSLDAPAARVASLLCLFVAGAVVSAALLVLFGILPAAEEETIWNTEFAGSISDWWVQFGAVVAPAGALVAAWAMACSARVVVGRSGAGNA